MIGSNRSTFITSCLFSRAVLILFLVTSGVGLMPDEAQYWTWSLLPDVGYYSKPPGIAWQIWAGTSILGPTALGVRLIALLLPIGSGLIIQRIVTKLTGEEGPGWMAASAFILSPLGMGASFLATTDAPMVFFWLLATLTYISSIDHSSKMWKTGLCVALGALWKWMIYSFWIVTLVDVLYRKRLNRSFLVALCLSCLGIIPALYWNWNHDWGGFHHVEAALFSKHNTPSSGNPLSFVLAGIALISPGFFLLALPGLSSRNQKTSCIKFTIAIIWGALFILSCSRKIQGNWAVVAQASFFPLLGVVLHERSSWQRWPYKAALIFSVVCQIFILSTPYLGSSFLKICPFKQGMGTDFSTPLIDAGYNPSIHFLLSDRYQSTSQLWFYGPNQHKAYFLNIHDLRHNQYSYWPGMETECVGKTGYFVAIIPLGEHKGIQARSRRYRQELRQYFSRIGKAHVHILRSISQAPVRIMIIIPCIKYTGHLPPSSTKF